MRWSIWREAWVDADRAAVRVRPLGGARRAWTSASFPKRWRGAGPRAWPMPPSWPRTHGPRLGLDVTTCYDYLTKVLSYDLGEPEIAGLRRFAAHGGPARTGPGRSEPCLPPSPRSCSAPLRAGGWDSTRASSCSGRPRCSSSAAPPTPSAAGSIPSRIAPTTSTGTSTTPTSARPSATSAPSTARSATPTRTSSTATCCSRRSARPSSWAATRS